MKLELTRTARRETYTIGRLTIDGEYFCDTLEDKDRGLRQDMPEAECIRLKVPGKTAIPAGTYRVAMNVRSAKFCYRTWAQPYGGCVPRLLNVKAFEGVLIHPGTNEDSTSGCLLVGQNKVKGALVNSQETFHRLMAILLQAKECGDEIIINIKNDTRSV